MFHTNMGKRPLAVRLILFSMESNVTLFMLQYLPYRAMVGTGHVFMPCFLFPSQIALTFPSEKIAFPSLGIGYLADLPHRPAEFFPFIFWDGHLIAKELLEKPLGVRWNQSLTDSTAIAIEHFLECKEFRDLSHRGAASGEPLVWPFPS